MKGSLGTGILAMPNAFHHSGYAVGAIGTVVIGLLCTYCIHLLIRAEYELCKRKKVIFQFIIIRSSIANFNNLRRIKL